MKSFLLLSTALLALNVFAQQFKSGNHFHSIPIYGQVWITCQNLSSGESKTVHYTCSDLRLDPVEFDYFIGPAGVKADQVELSAVQASGKKVEKKANYEDGQSSKRFNLWIQTLLQKPLLDEGKNLVTYKMSLEGQKTAEGTFEALIERGQSKTCPQGNISSSTLSDCDSPYTACQIYFDRYNYCF